MTQATSTERLYNEIKDAGDWCLKAPIRTGKTHTACKKAIHDAQASKKPALYVLRSHEQCKHVTKIIDRLGGEVIHFAGQRWRASDYPLKNIHSCSPCKFYETLKLAKKNRNQTVRALEEYIRTFSEQLTAIVTVPELAIHLDPELFCELIFDEENTLKWFFPQTHCICEYERNPRKGEYKEINKIEKLITSFDDYYMVTGEENAEEAKERILGGSYNTKDIYILVRDYLVTLSEILRSFREKVKAFRQDGVERPELAALNEIEDQTSWAHSQLSFLRDLRTEKDPKSRVCLVVELMEAVKKKSFMRDDMYEAFHIFADLLCMGTFKAISLPEGAKVYFSPAPEIGIKDVSYRIILFKYWLKAFPRRGVVLNKTSSIDERFYECLGIEYKTALETDFPFIHNFKQVIVKDPFDYAMRLKEQGIPALWVTGKKKDAKTLKDKLKAKGIRAEIAEDHTVDEINGWYYTGKQVIAYLNSAISKGVDLPMFDVVIVWNYNFATVGEGSMAIVNEVEQCIMRISPTYNFGVAQPKFIVWCGNQRRNNEALSEWVLELLHSRKDEIALKAMRSNWLPLDNLNGELAIPVSSRHLAERNIFLSSFVERGVEGQDHREITDVVGLLNGGKVTYNLSYTLTPPENGSFVLNSMIMLASSESEHKYALKLNPEALKRFLDRVQGTTLSYSEVITVAKECGITDVSVANYMVRSLLLLGLGSKSKEGRKTYYNFSERRMWDLDLACCGVLERFNIKSKVKPLFSFDEWRGKCDLPIDQDVLSERGEIAQKV